MAKPSTALPLSAWLLAIAGGLCLILAALLECGGLTPRHPLLAEPAAALALLVTGIALLASAAFPAALARLAAQDSPPQR